MLLLTINFFIVIKNFNKGIAVKNNRGILKK